MVVLLGEAGIHIASGRPKQYVPLVKILSLREPRSLLTRL